MKQILEMLKQLLQEGEQYAKENGLFFIETSAKTAQNVNELFYEIGNLNYPHHIQPEPSLTLNPNTI